MPTISNTIKTIVQSEEPLLEDEDVDPRELGELLPKIFREKNIVSHG